MISTHTLYDIFVNLGSLCLIVAGHPFSRLASWREAVHVQPLRRQPVDVEPQKHHKAIPGHLPSWWDTLPHFIDVLFIAKLNEALIISSSVHELNIQCILYIYKSLISCIYGIINECLTVCLWVEFHTVTGHSRRKWLQLHVFVRSAL